MRRVLLLSVVLMLAFSFLPGCGGGDTSSSPEVQKQKQKETEAAMEKGKNAMKNIKK